MDAEAREVAHDVARDVRRVLTTSSLRATVVVTAVFAGTLMLWGDSVLTLYATFSAVALLILESFDGTARQRSQACALVGLGGAALVAVAALASQVVWVAVAASFLVGLGLEAATERAVTPRARLPLLLAWVLAAVVPSEAVWTSASLGWLLGAAAAFVALLATWRREAVPLDASGAPGQRAARKLFGRGSSYWRRALPVACGVALAVLLTQLTGLPHAFWVVLATVTVLQPTVRGTERTYAQAVAATVAGAAIGAALVAIQQFAGVWVLWAAFPLSVLIWAAAPPLARRLSFSVSQAAFSAFLVVMFTLLQPSGYLTSLFRVGDVLIGGGIAVVVGALFWPRGGEGDPGEACDASDGGVQPAA
jgi:hypothetical protein